MFISQVGLVKVRRKHCQWELFFQIKCLIKNHICKLIFFAISSFLKIDEITSAREKTGELEKRGESQFI